MTRACYKYDMEEKGETRSRSLRIADDVWEAIRGLPGKTDDALREVLIGGETVTTPQAVGAAVRVMQRVMQRDMEHVLELVQGMPSVSDVEEVVRRVIAEFKAAKAAGSSAVSENGAPAFAGFPIRCLHCPTGDRGATKFATICFECKGSGHFNQPAECPVCTVDYGTGAL